MSGQPESRMPAWYAAAHARNLGAAALRMVYRLQGHGMHALGTQGPLIVVCPSEAVLAAPVLIALAPRPIHVLPNAALSTVASPTVLERIGAIAVHAPTAIDAQRSALQALNDGRAVAVVGSQVDPGWLLAMSGAPLVVVTLLGESGAVSTDPPRPGARIQAYAFGPVSVEIPGDPLRTSVREAVGERVRQSVADATEWAERRAGRKEAS